MQKCSILSNTMMTLSAPPLFEHPNKKTGHLEIVTEGTTFFHRSIVLFDINYHYTLTHKEKHLIDPTKNFAQRVVIP